ncbi:hypothetical protein AHP1_1081 [Aeromonas phage Ahp1_CNU-2021]|nr:hypothetical protein AHP1_1081 [Aeromonas phage Ahp1_CNU-2021]
MFPEQSKNNQKTFVKVVVPNSSPSDTIFIGTKQVQPTKH